MLGDDSVIARPQSLQNLALSSFSDPQLLQYMGSASAIHDSRLPIGPKRLTCPFGPRAFRSRAGLRVFRYLSARWGCPCSCGSAVPPIAR